MAERRFGRVFQFRNDALRQHFAQLHAPLIERVNVPDGPLRKDTVLVECNQLAKCCRRKPFDENRVRRAIALKDPVGHEPVRRALGLDLFGRLAECQGLPLGDHVRQ